MLKRLFMALAVTCAFGAPVLLASTWHGDAYRDSIFIGSWDAELDDTSGYIEGTWQATHNLSGAFDGKGLWDSENERWIFRDQDWWTTPSSDLYGYWSGYFDIGGADDGSAAGEWRRWNSSEFGTWSGKRTSP